MVYYYSIIASSLDFQMLVLLLAGWTLFCNYVDPLIRSHLERHCLEMHLVLSLPMNQSDQKASVWKHRDLLM